MENKYLIDLSIRYGLKSSDISELVSLVSQTGAKHIDSREFKRVAKYICDAGLLGKPNEEIIEELRLKGLMKN